MPDASVRIDMKVPEIVVVERIDRLPTARFIGKSDRVFNRHRGGKIHMAASLPINTLQVLRDACTRRWPRR